jgi:acyl-CoA thioesterase
MSDERGDGELGGQATRDAGVPADLAADTAVTPTGAGRYACALPRHWDYFTPSGGVLMTIALRAIAAELALRPEQAAQRAVSATTVFCAPVLAGAIEVDVTVLRRGTLASQARAALRMAGGETGLEVVATWARERSSAEATMTTAPPVPDPQALPPIDASDQRLAPNFIRNLDHRRAIGTPWWRPDEWVRGDRSGYWYRYLRPQALADGRLDPLALPPLIDTMPPAMCAMLGPDARSFLAPSLDLTVHFVRDTTSQWLLTHVRCREARAGFATADIEVWDEARRLVAVGTQVMVLRRRRELPPSL